VVVQSKTDIEKLVEELKPWRYNHSHQGITIRSDTKASKVFDQYGRGVMTHILSVLLKDKRPEDLRAIDLGCLEGHYSDIFCSSGFKEVVSVDLGEGHVKRANFLLKELKKYPNSTILQGNVCDARLMLSLGKFNIVFFSGLLYHLKDPLKIFDIIERLIPEDGDFYLLLFTQYKESYNAVVSPYPIAELQVKPLRPFSDSLPDGLLFSPKDESVFERCSFRLNPAAVYEVLKLYNYNGIISVDTPGGYSYSFHSNLIVTKNRLPALVEELNRDLNISGVRFYEWEGKSVNSYDFDRRIEARIARFLIRVSHIKARTVIRCLQSGRIEARVVRFLMRASHIRAVIRCLRKGFDWALHYIK
jgi:SAM-dependent methyltransferase